MISGYFDIGVIAEIPEKFRAVIKEQIPTRDFGNPENIFSAVNFYNFISDYINESSIAIIWVSLGAPKQEFLLVGFFHINFGPVFGDNVKKITFKLVISNFSGT